MKKSILLAIIGLTAGVVPSFGSGTIVMDNYNTLGPYITYGPGSGALTGQGLGAGWTAGLYYALGDITGSIAADPTGRADPSSLGALTLGTGPGSTAAFWYSTAGLPGEFVAGSAFGVPGTADAGGDTITLMIVAYNDSSYAASLYRGHSAPFTMTTSAMSSPAPHRVGDYMPGFSVVVPEPATLALGSLGLAALLLASRGRRKESSASSPRLLLKTVGDDVRSPRPRDLGSCQN